MTPGVFLDSALAWGSGPGAVGLLWEGVLGFAALWGELGAGPGGGCCAGRQPRDELGPGKLRWEQQVVVLNRSNGSEAALSEGYFQYMLRNCIRSHLDTRLEVQPLDSPGGRP